VPEKNIQYIIQLQLEIFVEMPTSSIEEMDVIGSSGEHEWDVDTMMLTGGIWCV